MDGLATTLLTTKMVTLLVYLLELVKVIIEIDKQYSMEMDGLTVVYAHWSTTAKELQNWDDHIFTLNKHLLVPKHVV